MNKLANIQVNKQANKQITFFCIVTGLFWLALYGYVPIVSSYANDMLATGTMIGLIGGAYGFTQMMLRIPIGIMSDKIGKRKPFIIFGIIFTILAGITVCISQSPMSLLVARAFGGFAAAAWVPFTVMFSDYFKHEDAPKAMGIISAVCNGGQFVGSLLCGVVARTFGKIQTFGVSTSVGALALVLAFFIKEKSSKSKHNTVKIHDLVTVTREKNVLLVSVLAIFCQYITFSTTFTFTPLIAKSLHAGDLELGILTALNTLMSVFGALACNSIVKRIGAKRLLMFSFAVMMITCFAKPLAPGLFWLYVLQIIAGLSGSLAFTTLMSLVIKDVAPNRRASAMGFFQAVYALGMFLGPVFTGVIDDLGNMNWGFWALSLIAGIALIITATLYKDKAIES